MDQGRIYKPVPEIQLKKEEAEALWVLFIMELIIQKPINSTVNPFVRTNNYKSCLQHVPNGETDSIPHEIDASSHPVIGRREKYAEILLLKRAEKPWPFEKRHEHRSAEANDGADDLGDAP